MDETGRRAHDVAPSCPVDGMTGEAAADLAAFLAASGSAPVDHERLHRLCTLVPAFGVAVDTGTLDDDQVAAVVDESLGYADADVTAAVEAVLPTAASLPADVLADVLAARLFSPTISAPHDEVPGRHEPDLPDAEPSDAEPSRAALTAPPDSQAEPDRATHEIVRGRLAALRPAPPHRPSPVVDTTPADTTPAEHASTGHASTIESASVGEPVRAAGAATTADCVGAAGAATPADRVEPTDLAEPTGLAEPNRALPNRALPNRTPSRLAVGALLLATARLAPRAHLASGPVGARPSDPATPSAPAIPPSPTPGPAARGPPEAATAADPPTSSSWDAGRTITADTAGVPYTPHDLARRREPASRMTTAQSSPSPVPPGAISAHGTG